MSVTQVLVTTSAAELNARAQGRRGAEKNQNGATRFAALRLGVFALKGGGRDRPFSLTSILSRWESRAARAGSKGRGGYGRRDTDEVAPSPSGRGRGEGDRNRKPSGRDFRLTHAHVHVIREVLPW